MLKILMHRYGVIVFMLFGHTVLAQEVSVQLSPGMMNYGGDLQSAAYTFKGAGFSFGADVFYRINKFSIRSGAHFGKVLGSDAKYTNYKSRNLEFASNIVDGNLCLQYDVFSLAEKKITPYLFAGVGIFHFNPYTNYNGQKVYLQPLGTEGQGLTAYPQRKMYALTQFNVPAGIGVKYKLSDRIQVGLELCGRMLLTDYLDDVSGKYPDENELFKGRGQLAVDLSFRGDELDPSLTFPSDKQRGNPAHNDNYYTTSLTFIYTLTQHSLFGGIGKRNRAIKDLDCPKNVNHH